MRPFLLIGGVIVTVFAVIFSFMPVFTPTGGASYGAEGLQAKSVLLDSRLAFDWSGGGASDVVEVVDCGTSAPPMLNVTTGPSSVCRGQVLLGSATGSSGKILVSAAPNSWVVVAAFTAANGTLDASAAILTYETEGLVGIPMLFLGAFVVILGLLLSPRPGFTLRGEGPSSLVDDLDVMSKLDHKRTRTKGVREGPGSSLPPPSTPSPPSPPRQSPPE